jgi:hypothetical protein
MLIALGTAQGGGMRALSVTDYCEIAATAARLRRPHNKPIRAIARPQWWRLLTK